MLKEMRDNGEGFYQFARRLSLEQWRYFSSMELDKYFRDHMQELGRQSLAKQQLLEKETGESLDAFLQRYFSRQI
jgi:glutamate--cysteine ligase